jgi:crotonobetainyl-CoA:carnitine CoA-transferase CaiB-like acyl-CoA transferase
VPGPLAGIRIVDCSAILSGPLVTEVLVERDHPTAGGIRQPRPPARFERTPPSRAAWRRGTASTPKRSWPSSASARRSAAACARRAS